MNCIMYDEDAESISKMIGDKTVITSSLSLSDSGQGGSNKTSSGEQLSYHIIYLTHMFNNVAFFKKA
ncbi:hypothetical protein [Spiroplasma citri]|uniref:Uncharacterized protein n=2 Tax=Spiroplasma citri TaxID=2133 RepID=A0AAJ4JYX2_SPICI|nr:hypothetical protein [Spiroplasma citri]QED24937.1 hypothetical protein FRX96_05930 [Spiroplasma citri]QIA67280.1 hypothetical protein GMI18_06325 [Spiroplasma citri]QIA69161.1 hypothetical protein GL298_06425 [Spiroplasma citri]QJU60983.1 hypothetical protein HHA36_06000 [Spiroplasma citri]WFG99300.1 TraG/TraD/VirD4 family protein [Spiroplasma citri]